jgi:diguanylate cyclase (GGDEF)-like protein/PAS domain S-box-containing protein
MRRDENRPNFTFLWALGALSAVCWVFEPVLGEAIQTGGNLAAPMVVNDPEGLWMRGAVACLFVLLGIYEQATLARLESRAGEYKKVVASLPDMVWTATGAGPRMFLSPALERVFGHSAEAYAKDDGGLWWNSIHPDEREKVRDAYRRLFATETPFALQYRLRRQDGAWVWVEERSVLTYEKDGVRRANGVVADITERKKGEEARAFANQVDPLTRLPGRHLLHDRLRQTLAHARRHDHQSAILFLEIAGLKEVAENLGREVADPLLKEVTARVHRIVREEDTVARYDDQHLVVVLTDIAEPPHASRVTRELIHELNTLVEVQGQVLALGVNVGLSFFPADGDLPETLVKNAATAMERSRERGRNTYELYTREMHEAAVTRLRTEAALRRAVENDELELHYQPQLDLRTDRTIGLEALVRWNRPGAGMVGPVHFVPLAEETGLIVPMGLWILRAACTRMTTWKSAGVAPGRVSVNVSARQFEDGRLAPQVARILTETALAPEHLELEITESALVRNEDAARKTLHALKDMGVRIAVDDFGTGQAALAYLKRFPIDTLKIDRLFVISCAEDRQDAAIIRAVIGMAHNLGLEVVAEGVETDAQLAFLRANGCDTAQGYLLGKPMAADGVSRLLGRQATANGTAAD